MRLDKWLKNSRLIKRRTIANEACDAGKITANGRVVKASYEVKSGDLLEVARVVKGLRRRENQRGLSNGERKMLHTAKQILISELVLAQSLPYETVENSIDTVLSN